MQKAPLKTHDPFSDPSSTPNPKPTHNTSLQPPPKMKLNPLLPALALTLAAPILAEDMPTAITVPFAPEPTPVECEITFDVCVVRRLPSPPPPPPQTTR